MIEESMYESFRGPNGGPIRKLREDMHFKLPANADALLVAGDGGGEGAQGTRQGPAGMCSPIGLFCQ